MDKKGALGLETVKYVIITLLTLAVIVVVMFLAAIELRNSVESVETLRSGTIVNETITSVTHVYRDFSVLTSPIYSRNPTCAAASLVTNASGTTITSGNYTQTGCYILHKTGLGAGNVYNNTNWLVSYTLTYNSPETSNLVANVTTGVPKFFTNVPTFFTLLGVVVLILLITLIIVSVTKFGSGGGAGMRMGGRSSSEEGI